jgi:hypothetical protein
VFHSRRVAKRKEMKGTSKIDPEITLEIKDIIANTSRQILNRLLYEQESPMETLYY